MTVQGIGEVSFFEKTTCDEKVKQQTIANINSLLAKEVLTKEMAQKLTNMFLKGEISFGQDGLTVEEAANLDVNQYNSVINKYNQLQSQLNASGEKKTEKTTQYTVQAGDTPEIIAKKMGLTGNEAKEFARQIKETAQKEGKYHSFGFRAGDTISLPGDYADKIKQLEKNGSYHTDISKINQDYVEKTKTREAQKTRPSQSVEKPNGSEGTGSVNGTEEPASAGSSDPVKAPAAPNVPAAKTPGYSEPAETQKISLKDLKQDDKGRYIIPEGNWSIDSSELPADDVKFVLENENSVLVFDGPLKSAETNNYKPPTSADIVIRNSDPKDQVYKSGDFEYRPDGYYYKGQPINPDEWDITVSDIKGQNGLKGGIAIHAVKKDTVMKQEDITTTERHINIEGKGKFYAKEISCPIDADVSQYEIGTLGKGAGGVITGDGNIQTVDSGNLNCLTLTAKNKVNIRNIYSGLVMGKNVDVDTMRGGEYYAEGNITELKSGDVSNPNATITIMNGGHVLEAKYIKVMNGGFLDLYHVAYANPRKTIVENYIKGRIDSCDKSLVIIKNGFDEEMLADADSKLKEKRGGKIVTKEPPKTVETPQETQTAGVGSTVWNWIKGWFN